MTTKTCCTGDCNQGRDCPLRAANAKPAAPELRVLENLSGAAVRGECTIPPPGWHCTRAPGHEGPCAAWPVAAPQQSLAPAAAPFDRAEFIRLAVLAVAEIPDRDSPEGQPEMMSVTGGELKGILESGFELAAEGQASAAVPAELLWVEVNLAAVTANKAFGQWMPERWLQEFVKAYNFEVRTTQRQAQSRASEGQAQTSAAGELIDSIESGLNEIIVAARSEVNVKHVAHALLEEIDQCRGVAQSADKPARGDHG